MEEKKFTLRISPEEAENLETLKKFLKLSTDAAAIRHAISNYQKLESTIVELRHENNNLKFALVDTHNRIKDFNNSLKRLMEIH